ncbi:MAG: hypothetical protein EB075_13995 [Bacteroidetes bacterium]|nr:hypothetical protein [Bacteroidota bacterium]
MLPGSDTSIEANAADLAELSNMLVELGIATIFTDAESTDVDARALADRLGIDITALRNLPVRLVDALSGESVRRAGTFISVSMRPYQGMILVP